MLFFHMLFAFLSLHGRLNKQHVDVMPWQKYAQELQSAGNCTAHKESGEDGAGVGATGQRGPSGVEGYRLARKTPTRRLGGGGCRIRCHRGQFGHSLENQLQPPEQHGAYWTRSEFVSFLLVGSKRPNLLHVLFTIVNKLCLRLLDSFHFIDAGLRLLCDVFMHSSLILLHEFPELSSFGGHGVC